MTCFLTRLLTASGFVIAASGLCIMLARRFTKPFSSSACFQQRHRHHLLPAPSRARRHERHAAVRPAAAAWRRDETATGAEANTILDAFFLGRAFAETVNERLGAALGDLLSEISRLNAERDYYMRSFQQEVQQRADREKERRTGLSLGASTSSATVSASAQPASSGRPFIAGRSANGTSPIDTAAAPDVQAEVDELRAEVAAAKAAVQRLKADRQEGATTGAV